MGTWTLRVTVLITPHPLPLHQGSSISWKMERFESGAIPIDCARNLPVAVWCYQKFRKLPNPQALNP